MNTCRAQLMPDAATMTGSTISSRLIGQMNSFGARKEMPLSSRQSGLALS